MQKYTRRKSLNACHAEMICAAGPGRRSLHRLKADTHYPYARSVRTGAFLTPVQRTSNIGRILSTKKKRCQILPVALKE